MHLLLCAEDSEAELRSELAQSSQARSCEPAGACTASRRAAAQGALVCARACSASVRWPHLAFARQLLPDAGAGASGLDTRLGQPSVRGYCGSSAGRPALVAARRAPLWHAGSSSDGRAGLAQPGAKGRSGEAAERDMPHRRRTLAADAGRHRCTLVREALVEMLQKKRRHLLRRLRREPRPFTAEDSLVQVLLTAPDSGFLSVAPAPLPYAQRHLVAAFPKGEVPIAADKAAPEPGICKVSRSGVTPGPGHPQGETCVDLGAAPGSWTYVAVSRGGHVIAVDRSPLREDLMRSPHVEFRPGDAFRFQPARPVDWLLCDVIAAPERSADLLLEWLRRGWCRQFVVTLKVGKGPMTGGEVGGLDVLARLKGELPPLTSELFLTRLCANKREVCAFGKAR